MASTGSPALSLLFIIFNLLCTADARTTKSKPFKLVLEPSYLACFIISIVFGVIFLLGALSTLGKLGNDGKPLPTHRKGESYFTGKPYFFILFSTFLSLIVYYILSALAIVFTLNSSKADLRKLSPPFLTARNAMLPVSHWLIVCALLVLVFRRERVTRGEGYSRRYLYKSVGDMALLVIYLSLIISGNSLQAAQLNHTINRLKEINQIGQALIAFQIILTVDVVASAIWMWMKLKAESLPDSIMIGQIVKFILPLIIVQEIYVITEYALDLNLFLQTNFREIANALFLARLTIFGVTDFLILWFAV